MTKIQFGSSGNLLDGWLNLQEHQCDISKPLPYQSDSVDFLFAEHVVEHVAPGEGYRFFKECRRVLRTGGVVRIVVPDISKIWLHCDAKYLALLQEGMKTWWPAAGLQLPSDNYFPNEVDAVESLIFCHGHKSVYTEDMLMLLMEVAGLDVTPCDYMKSQHPELHEIDSHWKYMGLENCILESCVCEGTKK